MVKRTMENCGIKKKVGDPGKDGNGKCMGFGRSRSDDEPCEACRKCKYCTSYEEEQDKEKPKDLGGTKKKRTLKIIQKEYEEASAAAAACERSRELEQEITDYRIQHGMYYRMSELMQYKEDRKKTRPFPRATQPVWYLAIYRKYSPCRETTPRS